MQPGSRVINAGILDLTTTKRRTQQWGSKNGKNLKGPEVRYFQGRICSST